MDKSLIEKQQVPKTQLDFFYKPSKHVHLQFILKFKSKGQAHLTSFNSKLNLTISGVPSLESIIRFFLNTWDFNCKNSIKNLEIASYNSIHFEPWIITNWNPD